MQGLPEGENSSLLQRPTALLYAGPWTAERRRSRTNCIVLSGQTYGLKILLILRLSNSWPLTSFLDLQLQKQALKPPRSGLDDEVQETGASGPSRLQANCRWVNFSLSGKLLRRAQRYLWRTQEWTRDPWKRRAGKLGGLIGEERREASGHFPPGGAGRPDSGSQQRLLYGREVV